MIGWIAMQVLAALVVIVGLVLVARRAYQEMYQPTSIKLGDSREMTSTHVGLSVLGLGIVFSLLVWLFIKPDEQLETATSHPPRGTTIVTAAPTLPNAIPSTEVGIPEGGAGTPSPSPVGDVACGSPTGPWEGDGKGVYITIADVGFDNTAQGRIRFTLRMENRSNDFATVDHSKIMAIDSNEKQYGIDDSSVPYGISIASGEVVPATITLDSKLQGTPSEVTLQFNFSAVFLDYWTIPVCVPIPAAG